MFKNFSNNVMLYAAKNNYIKEDEIELRSYGFNLLLTILLNDVTVIFIGVVIHMTIEAIAFWFIYTALKKYTGGFHFNSSIICYLSTIVMSIMLLFLIKYCRFDSLTYSIMMIISAAMLVILSPIPATQKPLDEKEIRVFGIVARILVTIAICVYFILYLLELCYAVKVLTFSMTFVAAFAIIGKLKYAIYNGRTENSGIGK